MRSKRSLRAYVWDPVTNQFGVPATVKSGYTMTVTAEVHQHINGTKIDLQVPVVLRFE